MQGSYRNVLNLEGCPPLNSSGTFIDRVIIIIERGVAMSSFSGAGVILERERCSYVLLFRGWCYIREREV